MQCKYITMRVLLQHIACVMCSDCTGYMRARPAAGLARLSVYVSAAIGASVCSKKQRLCHLHEVIMKYEGISQHRNSRTQGVPGTCCAATVAGGDLSDCVTMTILIHNICVCVCVPSPQSVAELEQKWQGEVEEAQQGKLENNMPFFYDYHFFEVPSLPSEHRPRLRWDP